MKKCAIAIAVLLGALAAGCHHSDDDGGNGSDGFVTGLIQSGTSEAAEPTPINGVDFAFSEDPHAFDALFQ